MALVMGAARYGGYLGGVVVRNCLAADNVMRSVDPHGFKAGDVVLLKKSRKGGGSWPLGGTGGFALSGDGQRSEEYHVLASGLKTREFKLSATAGGSAVAFAQDIVVAEVFPKYDNVEALDACSMAAYDGLSNTLSTTINIYDAIGISSGSASTNRISTDWANGFSAGDRIIFMTREGGSGIRIGKTYYVNQIVDQWTFTLSLTSGGVGGAAVALGTDMTDGSVRKVPLTNLRTSHPRMLAIWLNLGLTPNSTDPRTELSANILTDIGLRGAVPVIYWQAVGPAASLQTVLDGDHDDAIDAVASRIAAYGSKVIVRWCQEMDGEFWPWSAGVNGNTAAKYRSAWKYVRDRVRNTTTLAKFLWTPLHGFDSTMSKRVEKWKPYWPGSAHVDYTGFDFYQWPINVKTRPNGDGLASTDSSDRLTFWMKDSGGSRVVGRHGLSVGQAFTFLSKTGGSNIVLGRIYYVIADGFSSSAFKFSTTRGGNAVSFGSNITAATVRGQESMLKQVREAVWAVRKLQGVAEPGSTAGALPIIIGELGYFGKTDFTDNAGADEPDPARPSPPDGEMSADWEEEPSEVLTTANKDIEDVFRRTWFRRGIPDLADNFSDLDGIIYFDVEADLTSKRQPNWRLDAQPAVTEVFAALLNRPRFRGTIS